MLNKSLIIAGSLCIIAVIALITGIYNIVIYQNVSNILATGNLANMADTTDATKTADTSTGTTTAAVTTTPVSTDVITTNQQEECQRTLPFGILAGDEQNPLNIQYVGFNSCKIWDETLEQPFIYTDRRNGKVHLTHDTVKLFIKGIGKSYHDEIWSFFKRTVSSDKEKEAISCLVNNSNTVEANVFTWVKIDTQENEEEQVIQIILASLGQSATYIIRIYSDSLPTIYSVEPVGITYESSYIYNDQFLEDTVDDVRGKRQIFDITHAVDENSSLTVVEEGENCRIFC